MTTADEVRARNVATVQTYFRLQQEKDLGAWIALWAAAAGGAS
jgi:hypothetical protein